MCLGLLMCVDRCGCCMCACMIGMGVYMQVGLFSIFSDYTVLVIKDVHC